MLKTVLLENGDEVVLILTDGQFENLQAEIAEQCTTSEEYKTIQGDYVESGDIVDFVEQIAIGCQNAILQKDTDGVEIRCPECNKMFTIYDEDIQLYIMGVEITCEKC